MSLTVHPVAFAALSKQSIVLLLKISRSVFDCVRMIYSHSAVSGIIFGLAPPLEIIPDKIKNYQQTKKQI